MEIINKTRQQYLYIKIAIVVIGCILAIILRTILFGNGDVNAITYSESKMAIFLFVLFIYYSLSILCFGGFFTGKINALKRALHTMYHTDEKVVDIIDFGFFKNINHGKYIKDSRGFITYMKPGRN
jgi:H+/Cl- antiporter ClcA